MSENDGDAGNLTEALLDLPVDQAPTASLDLETTGLSAASGDRICELAVYRWRPDGVGKRKSLRSLIDPGVPMPPEAEAIHHIRDADLVGAPHFQERYHELSQALAGAVIVAHNARFDVGFLAAESHRLGLAMPPLGPIICTLDLARNYFGFTKCSLEAVAWRTNTPQPKAHRALDDARVTFQVYAALLKGIAAGFGRMPTVRELIETTEQLGKDGQERRRILSMLAEAARVGDTLTVDYTARHGQGPLTCRRTLTARSWDPPHLEAWCHLRGEIRVFNARRVQRILQT